MPRRCDPRTDVRPRWSRMAVRVSPALPARWSARRMSSATCIAKGVTEDKGGRGLAIFPDRQCCPQMRDADLCLPIQQGVDER